MSLVPKKSHWLEIAIQVYNFHVSQVEDDPSWTIKKTSVALERSVGSVSQYISVASYVHTHERQLRKFRSLTDAIEFVRDHKREIGLRKI